MLSIIFIEVYYNLRSKSPLSFVLHPLSIFISTIERIRLLAEDELCLTKYLKQLEILSNLRNLQEQTIKTINNMALTYDLKSDLRYKAGLEAGREEAKEKNSSRSANRTKSLKYSKFPLSMCTMYLKRMKKNS